MVQSYNLKYIVFMIGSDGLGQHMRVAKYAQQVPGQRLLQRSNQQ